MGQLLAWSSYQFGRFRRPRLRQRSADIRHTLTPRELRWLRRQAFHSARRDVVAAMLMGIGSMVLMLLPFTVEIARSFQAPRTLVFWTVLAVGIMSCLAGLGRWRSRYAWSIPGLLLQINRCGCCGAGFPKRGGAWTANSCCPECGLAWSPLARLGPMDTALERDAA